MRGFVVRGCIGGKRIPPGHGMAGEMATRDAMLRQYREPQTLTGWEKSVSHEAES